MVLKGSDLVQTLEINLVVLGLLFIPVRKAQPAYFIPLRCSLGQHPGVPCAKAWLTLLLHPGGCLVQ